MQDHAQDGMKIVRQGAERAIEQIPPEAWPVIDLMFRITIALTIIWILLELIAWWRRRAYNLTIASTARRNKEAQPDFLNVDNKAREKAIERGEDYEEKLEERERQEALEALKAAKEPVTIASRIASVATFLMSVFTLITGFSGAIFGVGRIGGYLEDATTAGKFEYLIQEHPIGCIIVAFVIGYHIWRYFAEKKWEKA